MFIRIWFINPFIASELKDHSFNLSDANGSVRVLMF